MQYRRFYPVSENKRARIFTVFDGWRTTDSVAIRQIILARREEEILNIQSILKTIERYTQTDILKMAQILKETDSRYASTFSKLLQIATFSDNQEFHQIIVNLNLWELDFNLLSNEFLFIEEFEILLSRYVNQPLIFTDKKTVVKFAEIVKNPEAFKNLLIIAWENNYIQPFEILVLRAQNNADHMPDLLAIVLEFIQEKSIYLAELERQDKIRSLKLREDYRDFKNSSKHTKRAAEGKATQLSSIVKDVVKPKATTLQDPYHRSNEKVDVRLSHQGSLKQDRFTILPEIQLPRDCDTAISSIIPIHIAEETKTNAVISTKSAASISDKDIKNSHRFETYKIKYDTKLSDLFNCEYNTLKYFSKKNLVQPQQTWIDIIAGLLHRIITFINRK